MSTIKDFLKNWTEEKHRICAQLTALVLALPDNPKIKRLGGGALSVSSSAIFDDPTMRMDVAYYDFKLQYELISGEIMKANDIEACINSIIETKEVSRGKNKLKLHDDVVNNLKNIMNENIK